jgi:hypothetical protein
MLALKSKLLTMKALFLLVFLFVFSFGASQAQITLEANYPIANSNFNVLRFGLAGDKYVYVKDSAKVIEIYSLNHTLEKSFSIPSFIVSDFWNVRYISDNLFDADSAVEYVITDAISGFAGSHLYVLKEDGSILLDRDSVSESYADDPFMASEFGMIIPTVGGSKMIFRQANSGWQVYSLPGNLPCYECSDGEFNGSSLVVNTNQNPDELSNPYPNPTGNLTRIDYQLPNGIKQGELVFYNTMGNEVKRFKVTGTFSFINVSIHDLPSGTYYYILETSAGASEGKKMVVIR